MKTRKGFKPKEQRFINEYLKDQNGTQAAIRAGFSKKTACSQASRLLRKAHIKAEIDRILDDQADRVIISRDEILKELKNIGMFDPINIFNDDGTLKDIGSIPPESRRVIAGIDIFEEYDGRGNDKEFTGYTKKVKLCDKVTALTRLGQYLKLFTNDPLKEDSPGTVIQVVVRGPQPITITKQGKGKQSKNEVNEVTGGSVIRINTKTRRSMDPTNQ